MNILLFELWDVILKLIPVFSPIAYLILSKFIPEILKRKANISNNNNQVIQETFAQKA